MNKELEGLFNLSITTQSLDSKHLDLLNYLLNNPGITAYNFYKSVKDIPNRKHPDYKSIWRIFNRLHELNLIEQVQGFKTKESDRRDSILFKLSLNGIFYMILNPTGYLFYDELIIPLLRKYSSNALFVIFLYPLINQKTLLEIKDDNIFTIIYGYLKDICNVVIIFIKSLNGFIYDEDNDGYVLNKLFTWPRSIEPLSSPESISFNEDNLKNYLKKKFNWDWLDKSKITPNYEQNWIDIFKPNNAEVIRLSIDEKENKAILMMDDKNMDEFIITIHELFLSIDIKTKEKKEDLFLQRLKDDCKIYQSGFLINLRNQANSNHNSFKLLSDENFIKSLKNININIKND